KETARCIADNGFIASVPDFFTARLLSETAEECGRPIKAHLQTNTGMNRYGMNLSMLGRVCKFLAERKTVEVGGMYSHLYDHSRAECERQRGLFLKMQSVFRRYFKAGICHLSSTYVWANFLDMVRVDWVYGYFPSGANGNFKVSVSKGDEGLCVGGGNKYSFGGAGCNLLDGEKKTRSIVSRSTVRAMRTDFQESRTTACGVRKRTRTTSAWTPVSAGKGVRGSFRCDGRGGRAEKTGDR
ncbi:MAG: alanine racemase, partial [Christensenellaceae bacterium]